MVGYQKSLLVLRGLTAWNNSASYGGVVYAEGLPVLMSGVLAFNNGAFSYNNSASFGGVLYCVECELVGT